MENYILTINAGSSSIKFAVYVNNDELTVIHSGKIERIGLSGTILTYHTEGSDEVVSKLSIANTEQAVTALLSFLETRIDFHKISVVGHRIVHGMNRAVHAIISAELIAELKQATLLAPEHLPLEIAIIEKFTRNYPELSQVACFDTVFHHNMPRVAQLLPLPRRFTEAGMRHYGFHGLSCAYIMEELKNRDPQKALGRTIVAHLGNGASITAVNEGKSIDTSMGFTPAGGILMSTRTGDIDPGTLLYIMKNETLAIDKLTHLINHESGLLGVSGISSDMHDLLAIEHTNEYAKEAITLFCYEAKKRIGAYAAALGGIDTLIFSGGMGGHAPRIRTQICTGLEFLGITLDETRNQTNDEIISIATSSTCVRIINTNEELMIAQIAKALIKK